MNISPLNLYNPYGSASSTEGVQNHSLELFARLDALPRRWRVPALKAIRLPKITGLPEISRAGRKIGCVRSDGSRR